MESLLLSTDYSPLKTLIRNKTYVRTIIINFTIYGELSENGNKTQDKLHKH